MPDYRELINEAKMGDSTYDLMRRKYLGRLYRLTGRNVIVYYSGWLGRANGFETALEGFELDEEDKTGFIATIENLDRSKGLDLLLHTPGGGLGATESLVTFLRSQFGKDIRAVIPQISLTTGTMLALACRQIVMGSQSSLGPIDVHIDGVSAYSALEEFEQFAVAISKDPKTASYLEPIIAQYGPTFINECRKAVRWCGELSKQWLAEGVFDGIKDARHKASKALVALGKGILAKSADARVSFAQARDILGDNVIALEDDERIRDAVMSIHHVTLQTLSAVKARKIIENQRGVVYIAGVRE